MGPYWTVDITHFVSSPYFFFARSCLATHMRQAALAAIGNGWFVWSDKQHKIPFSRAELALAAVSFRGRLQLRMLDDPAQVIFPMI